MSNAGNIPLSVEDYIQPIAKGLESMGVAPDRAQLEAQRRLQKFVMKGTGGASLSLSKAMATTGVLPEAGTVGADALKVEDVVAQVQVTELESKNFCPFWHTINKAPALSDVVQTTEMNAYGGTDDNQFLDESLSDGGMGYDDPNIERHTLPVKWLGGMGQVMRTALAVEAMGISGDPAQGNAEEIAEYARLEALLKGCNWSCWNGDNGKNSLEFNGALAQIRAAHMRGSDRKTTRVNLNGQPITPNVLTSAEYIFFENGGVLNELWFGGLALSDTKKLLQNMNAARSGFGERIQMGQIPDSFVIQEMNLDTEIVKLKRDHHLDPYKGDGKHQPSNTYSAVYKPAAVTGAVAAATSPNVWGGYLPAGSYEYAVDGGGVRGFSDVRAVAAAVVVANGEKVTLSITSNSTETRTYRIWRRATGASSWSMLGRARAAAGGGVTLFVDDGEFVPGCGTAVALSNSKVGGKFSTVQFRHLWPVDKIQLPEMAMSRQFAWLTAGTIQLLKPTHNIIFENVGRVNS